MPAFASTRLWLAMWLLLCSATALAQIQDGWAKASPAESGFSESKLQALSAAVRSDEFKKIGSVLIARHGRLVFEDYVEGDANTLRDTRSATKSIADVLIGIASSGLHSARSA